MTADPKMEEFVRQIDALAVVMQDTIDAYRATLTSPHSMSNTEVRIAAQLVQVGNQVATMRRRAHQLARFEVQP